MLKIPTTNATRVSPGRFVKSTSNILASNLSSPPLRNTQSLLDPFSKLLSFVIQYGMFSLSYLIELCGLCYKAFNKVPAASVLTGRLSERGKGSGFHLQG